MEEKEIFQEIVYLDPSKACRDTDVPTKIIKNNADIFTDFVHPPINASVSNGNCPSFLKLASVIPVFKKDSKNSKDNNRPISILKNLTQIIQKNFIQTNRNIFGYFFQNFNAVLEKIIVGSSAYLR